MTKGKQLTDADVAGKRFNRLTVIRISGRRRSYCADGSVKQVYVIVECQCECGNILTPQWCDVKRGHTKSCGCHRRDVTIARSFKHGQARRGKLTPEWISWKGMIKRCSDPGSPDYDRYGGRGIKVCQEWQGPDGFNEFFYAMGKRPGTRYSLERKDNSLGYSPENCVWARDIEQANNKRNNFIVELAGQSFTVAELARELRTDLNTGTIYRRLHDGWPVERAFFEQPEVQVRVAKHHSYPEATA